MLLYGWQLIQHILMYFQVCSNSAYPQHSGERYRTNGPLVFTYFSKMVITLIMMSGPPTFAVSSAKIILFGYQTFIHEWQMITTFCLCLNHMFKKNILISLSSSYVGNCFMNILKRGMNLASKSFTTLRLLTEQRSNITRKRVFGDFRPDRFKPSCSAMEAS